MKRGRLVAVLAILAAAAILAVIAAPFLLRGVTERLRATVESRATQALGAPVTLARLKIALLPPAIHLEDLRGAVARGSVRAEGSIGAVRLRAGILTLVGLRRGPISVRIERPDLRLSLPASPVAAAGGAILLPATLLGRVPPGSSLRIEDGAADISLASGLHFRVGGLNAALDLAPGGPGLRGAIEFSGGEAEWTGRRISGLDGTATIVAGGPTIRISEVNLRGAGLTADGAAEVRWLGAPALTGDVRFGVDLGAAKGWMPAGVGPAGRLQGRLEGTWMRTGTTAAGEVEGTGLQVAGLPVDSGRADLRLDRGTWQVSGVRALTLGGEATGSAAVVIGKGADFDIRANGLDVTRLLALSGWTGPAIRGTMTYTGRHSIGGAGLATLQGGGDLTARGTYSSPRGRDLPLQLAIDIGTSGTTLNFRNGTLRAGSATGRFSGSFRPGEGIRLKLSGATGDLTELLPLFTAASSRRPAPANSPPSGGRASWWRSPRPIAAAIAPPVVPLLMRLLSVRQEDPAPEPDPAAGPDASRAVAGRPQTAGDGALERIINALGGRWQWEGDLRYGGKGMSFRGTLRASGLNLAQTDLGDLEAAIDYAGDSLRIDRAALRRPDGGRIDLSGTIRFGSGGTVAIQATADGYPVAPVIAAAGVALPVEGLFSGRLDIAGRPGSPTGRATIAVRPIRIAGLDLEALDGEVVFTPEILEVSPVVIAVGGGQIELTGRLPFSDAGDWLPAEAGDRPEVAIRGEGIDVTALVPGAAASGITGHLSVEGQIGGSIRSPVGAIRVSGADLAVRGVGLGPATIAAELEAGRVALRGGASENGLAIEGSLVLGPDKEIDLQVRLDGTLVPIGRVMTLAPDDARLEITGTASLSGPLADPRRLEWTADFPILALETAGLRVQSRGPARIAGRAGRILVEPVAFEGAGSEVTLAADVGLADGAPLEATAHGLVNLRLLGLLDRDLQATGRAEIMVRVGGVRGAPVWRGNIEAHAEVIRHPILPYPLSDLVLIAGFEEERLAIRTLEFLGGGGPVKGEGEIVLADAPGVLASGRLKKVQVRLTGRDMKSDFPRGLRSATDLDLTVTYEDGVIAVRGSVDFLRAVYTQDFGLDNLGRRGRNGLFRIQAAPRAFADTRLDVTLRAPGNVWLRNDLASLETEGELRVTGTVGRPVVGGRISAIEGGSIFFRGTSYRVTTGSIDFADPEEINPVFDVTAETRVQDYTVQMRLHGSVSELLYELTSDPPLEPHEVAILLHTGQTPDTLASSGRAMPEDAFSAYLAGAVPGEVTGAIGRWAGLDRVSVDPFQVDGQGDPTTRVTLGKQVTSDLFVAYSSDLGSSAESIYQLEYSLTRDLRFSSIRDQDGSIGGDFKYLLRGRPPGGVGGAAPDGNGQVINAVRLEGHPLFDEGQIRRRLRVRPGKRRDRTAINAGIERLERFYRNRDHLLARITHVETPAGPGSVDLVVTLESGPRVVLNIEGIRDREGIRQEIASAWQGGLPVEAAVAGSRDRLIEMLRDAAWLDAEVEAEIRRSDPEEVAVVFKVRRGVRAQAGEIRIVGAHRVPEKETRRLLRTRRDGLFSRGLVRDKDLRDDVEVIRTFYLEKGFPAVKVDDARLDPIPDDKRVIVSFPVEEGPAVTIREVRCEGNTAFTTAVLAATAAVEPGAPYSPQVVRDALVRLRRKYDEAGFPEARLDPRSVDVTRSDASRAEDLVIAIQEGPRQRMAALSFSGNTYTRDRVIERSMTLDPGDWISRKELLASQRRLYQRGIFRSVKVETRPAVPPDGSLPAPLPAEGSVPTDIHVEVREAPPIVQTFGVGYDSEEDVRALYEFTHHNIFGSGRHISFQGRASSLETRVAASYREVGMFGGRYDGLASAFLEDENHPGFDVRRIGTSIRFSRQITRSTATLYRYTLEDVDTTGDSTGFNESTLRLSSLAFSALHDTRDALFDPHRGHFLGGELQYFGEGIGSEATFARFSMQIHGFKEVAPRVVWAQALRAGIAVTFGVSRDDPASTGDAISGVPTSERFFAGGDTTVRGFERDRLGPIDPLTGDPTGGEVFLVVNEELRFPIWRFVSGALFYDGGNVYRTRADFDLSDTRHVAGFGLRLATPIGPFRLEYGALLDREPGEEHGQFFFSIGQAF